jgi:hypothetical protein
MRLSGASERVQAKCFACFWRIYAAVVRPPPSPLNPLNLMEYSLINELAGMFGKLADRLNAAAKRPFEYAVIRV